MTSTYRAIAHGGFDPLCELRGRVWLLYKAGKVHPLEPSQYFVLVVATCEHDASVWPAAMNLPYGIQRAHPRHGKV